MDPRRLIPALAALACACLVLTVVVGWTRSRPDRSVTTRPDAAVVGSPDTAADAARRGPAAVLAAWDERRSDAWADGDLRALRSLYVAGSRAGAADVALLRRYAERGLRVEGITTQVLALRVVRHAHGRLVLRTTDRVVGARAVGGPSGSVPLPVGRPATREVVLVRDGGRWRVAEATGQASAAASTSRTSSSSKS